MTKLIILAAGKSKKVFSEAVPSCLEIIDNKTILDNLINIANNNNINDYYIVGGYKILDIMQKYPDIKYYYNEKWEETKSLYSLSKSYSCFDENILISYSDIVHASETLAKIDKKKINVFYDSTWENRYEDRDINSVEKVYDNNKNLIGEYAGLIYIPKNKSLYIKSLVKELLKNNKKETLINLINKLSFELEINYIDISGNWAELDSVQDVEHFKFGTKAETLFSLKNKITKSQILDQVTFTVEEFKNNKKNVINKIRNEISAKLLVVRSSALNEDTHTSSMAGNYESILKVKKDDDSHLEDSINIVIDSYTKNNQLQNPQNQILVQAYLENVTMSGVSFTKDLQTSSPYYIVNYDKSDDTESVTSGNGSDLNTFIYYNNSKIKPKEIELKILIDSIKEIELVTRFDAIDVEFAFVGKKLYILQVRPIAAKKDSIKVSNIDIDKELNNIRKKVKEENVDLFGKKKAYGVMPDWNPAEIIGINPKALSFDLYRYIITDNIWAKSRSELGYKNVKNNAGLVSFCGKPYVDVQMSFSTFIPKSLDNKVAKKLVEYFIKKLKKNPHFHDKVEFEIAITAYDFTFENKLKELRKNGFSKEEISKIDKAYKKLTQRVILEKKFSIQREINKTLRLTKKREKILNSNLSVVNKIYNLLEDCKTYGTLPFSNLARFGFIGSIFLKSLLKKNILTDEQYDLFLKSIHTVAKDFMDDFYLLSTNNISKEKFLKMYGHLRPGTYDITSKSYKNAFENYIDSDVKVAYRKEQKFAFSEKVKLAIDGEIKKYKLDFTTDQLINFIIKATEAREKAKFEFTKSLSIALDLIEELGNEYGLSGDDLSHVNLYEILKYKNASSFIDFESTIRNNIEMNKEKYLITSAIKLPELIFNKKDVDMFFYPSSKPNFVSHHCITNKIVHLKQNEEIDINDKIVLIENADPGFDWIFSHNIKGLITKFGGAASHMAIRCAEFDIPAAIGCGDKIFNELVDSDNITLDCINQKVYRVS